MLAGKSSYQATCNLVPEGVTVILFLKEQQVMAEIITSWSQQDAVAPMPLALSLAQEHSNGQRTIFVVDDEDLWQPAWGTLQR